MKFAVHWAPSVKVMTPGWTAADDAGAHAEAAAGLIATIAIAATAHRRATSFLKTASSIRWLRNSFPVNAGSNQCGRTLRETRRGCVGCGAALLAGPVRVV